MDNWEKSFLDAWDELSSFGQVEGTLGVDRQAASAEDGRQRKWFETLLLKHGFTVIRDEIGNQIGTYELVKNAPYVLTGSHLDSQPTAGRFDGAYGVLASAFAAFRSIEHFKNHPEEATRNIAVVNWFNEEGSRFKPSLMGSSVFTGKATAEEMLVLTDRSGISVQEALSEINELGNETISNIASYAEIHVEQGRNLEDAGMQIGIVFATWGARKYSIRFKGEQAHSGATLMADRKDALAAASQIISKAWDLCAEFNEGELHTSVGEINVYPNSPVVVASEVTILLDLRSPHTEILDQSSKLLLDELAKVEQKFGVTSEILTSHSWEQNPYQSEGVTLAKKVAEEEELTAAEVMTVAGHDSTNVKDMVPTMMLFVPSKEGISHSVKEFTSDEDLINGLKMLTGSIKALVRGEL